MIYLVIFLVLLLVELFYFRIADKFNIIDKPNQRSSHTRITLRGGGIIFPIAGLVWSLYQGGVYPYFIVGMCLIALISFVDDIKPLSSSLRLPIHFVSMLLMFYQWDLFQMPWYYFIVALIVSTGLINIYNFMDGINGITGGYSTAVILSLLYINNYQVQFVENSFLWTVLCGLMVFNLFNFRKKAKCFAGDVGSVSIAFIIVFLIGHLLIRTGDFSYLLLLSVYGVDSVLTIAHRVMLKENITQPHRKHAYQLLANELKFSHLSVSAFYLVLQLIIDAGLFSMTDFKWVYFYVVLAVLMVAYILFKKKYFFLHLQAIHK